MEPLAAFTANPAGAAIVKEVRVRLDSNTYSVPHEVVGKTVHVRADDETVRVLLDGAEVARHPRFWGQVPNRV